MGLFDLFKKKEGPKALAKKAYENAVRLSGDSKAVRAVKVAMRAVRSRHRFRKPRLRPATKKSKRPREKRLATCH